MDLDAKSSEAQLEVKKTSTSKLGKETALAHLVEKISSEIDVDAFVTHPLTSLVSKVIKALIAGIDCKREVVSDLFADAGVALRFVDHLNTDLRCVRSSSRIQIDLRL